MPRNNTHPFVPSESAARNGAEAPAATAERSGARRAWLASAVLFIAATCGLFAVLAERAHYWPLVKSIGLDVTRGDKFALLWLLWFKSAALFVPVLLLLAPLVWTRRLRAASMLLVLCWTCVFWWLAVDLRAQQISGFHAMDFLPWIYDAATADEADHSEWTGDNSAIVASLTMALLVAAAAGVAGWWLVRRSTRLVVERTGRWVRRAPGALAGGCVLLAVLAPVAMCLTSNRIILRQAKASLPVSLPYFDQAGSFARSILTPHADANAGRSTVRIVALLPNPAGADAGFERVQIHNFTPQSKVLDGWRIQDADGNTHKLRGELPSGESKMVVLPEGSVTLNNDGDVIQLFDGQGKEIHRVDYGESDTRYGAFVYFREAGDYDEFELRLQTRVQSVYRSQYDAMFTAKPVDAAAELPAGSRPNVVMLVLESFRGDAVTPADMPRLHAHGNGGLCCARHYAGSNASHLGLFSLLYGRSALVYDATLEDGVPPQLVHTLKRSGYECHFLTSGDCNGFRHMEKFLNDEQFDTTFTARAESWKDRPRRDREVLERVRTLASETGGKPRFILAFLMSTHFPYTYPDEFRLHRPSGEDVTYASWKSMDRDVLRNRYRNAARFLDDEIAGLVDGLDRRRTVFVVTGDHGESLGEDGALGHGTRGSEVQCRVPLLMFGGRTPTSTIDVPTTHADVTPTLLHVLAGEHVALGHVHGRDVLKPDADLKDRVLLCPYRWSDPRDLVLVRGSERMLFKARLGRPEVRVFGVCDEHTRLRFDLVNDVTPTAADAWSQAFYHELRKINR